MPSAVSRAGLLADNAPPATVSEVTKRLFIAEKPSVAADVARALATRGERFQRTPWGWESPNWLVASARGHLVAEVDPDRYDERYKVWRLEDLPIIPERVLYQPRDRDSATLLKTLKGLIDRADVTSVVNGCDAGREGELIAKLVLQASRNTKPVERAWFSSMTADAILDALDHLRPDAEMQPLEAAARCRAEADWLVGINATRAATVHLSRRELLSLGRVQTPTLALIVTRDAEIANFTAAAYFTVTGRFATITDTFTATWFTKAADAERTRFDQRADADAVVARCAGRLARVAVATTDAATVKAPKLFDLTTLQQEANKRYGFPASKTLVAAQALYETHKALTYPRTDSNFVTADMVTTLPGVLAQVRAANPDLAGHVDAVIARNQFAVVVNDAKVTDHHAIIPTGGTHNLAALSLDERRIYDLVTRRFLAALSAPAEFLKSEIVVEIDNAERDTFRARGRVPVALNWQAIYPGPRITAPGKTTTDDADSTDADTDGSAAPDDETETTLPALTPGEPLGVEALDVHDKMTTPPSHFTDASLLGAMATAGRLVDDEELAAAMRDSGLGTPATRASILERLIKVGYLERKGKTLRATTKAHALLGALHGHALTSPEMTGGWERRLREIERTAPGTEVAMREQFLADIRAFTTDTVAWIAKLDTTGFSTADVLGPCPITGCSGSVVERAKSWSCTSWRSKEEPGCGFAIWKEQSGRKLSKSQAAKLLADAPPTIAARVEKVIVAPCPSAGCDGNIVARDKGYSCDSWRSKDAPGCGFVIWKSNRDGTVIDLDAAKVMIARGETNAAPRAEVLRPCPAARCKGGIVERATSFSCNSWSPKSKGCGTVVWKTDKAGTTLVTRDTLDEALAAAVKR
jgi:DNA topoisomerase III